jgi:hypothetical protein
MRPSLARSLPLAASLLTLASAGCMSNPIVSSYVVDDYEQGGLRLQVLHAGWRSTVEACGVRVPSRTTGTNVTVPYACVLPLDMPIESSHLFSKGELDSKPITVRIVPLAGATKEITSTVSFQSTDVARFVSAWLADVGKGKPLPLARRKSGGQGVVWVTPSVSAITKTLGGAKTIGDADLVVIAKHVNMRETDRVCSFEMATSAKLSAYDVDLEVYDARTAKKLGQKSFVNRSPSCPASVYARMGGTTTTSSGPPEVGMESWVRTVIAGWSGGSGGSGSEGADDDAAEEP